MKAINLWFAICLFLAMTFFPLFAIKSEEPQNNENKPDIVEEVNGETFRLYFSDSDKVTEISARDYIIGVVAGEMPLSYEPEALKAQAVAAYTYALFKKQNAAPDSKYDITAESGTDQKFATNNEIKEKCGENYDQLYKKLTQAVDSVLGQTITYQDKPIFAAYHSISSGKTEAANNVWAGSGDYLVPVESTGDIMSKDYLSEVKVSEEKFASELEKLGATVKKGKNAVGEIKRSDSGTVMSIKVGDKELKGSQIRAAFSLRSSNFDIAYSDGEYIFTVRGYGHNVGMSQFGAQFMALQGSNYIEILSWYYPECKLLTN